DIIFLVNSNLIASHFDELHRLSISNFIVFVFSNEDEIIKNKKVENLTDHYLPLNFSTIEFYNTISLGKKALLGHSVTIFPRKLIHSSVSEIEQLINSVSMRVFWKNLNGQYIGCNEKFANDFELRNIEEIIGKTDLELFDEKNALEFSSYDNQILKTGLVTDEYEKEIEFKSGIKKWIKFKKFPHLKEGIVIGVIGGYEVVGFKDESEVSHFYDTKLLSALMDNMPDTIYFKDKESRFIKINKAQCDFIGIENPEEAIGKTDFDFFNIENAKEAFAKEQQIIFDGNIQNNLEYVGTKSGQFCWMNSLKVPIKDEKGNTTGIVGISRNVHEMVTARQQLTAERDLLQLLIDNIPSPIFFKDSDLIFTRVNKALAKMLGASNVLDVIGKTDFDFYSNEQAEPLSIEENKIIESGVSLVNKIEDCNWKTESIKWLSTTKIPLRNKTGVCTGIIGISHDITEQIMIKQRLELAKQKAEAASVAKSNFLSNMSHEIRTPMNGIIGMSDVLSLSDLDADQEKIVNIISRSGNNLLSIINDILDLSKIEAGKLEIETAPMSLNELVDEVKVLLDFGATEANIELLTKIDFNIPELVNGDSLRIKQVLLNLVSNAIKFTQKGSVKIDVKILGYSDQKHCILFQVIDTGIGMDLSEIQHIFESFNQADSSTTRKYGGTGLGLSISHRLVKMMGGKLKVKSAKGKGSVFYFELMFDKVAVNEHKYF
ncbi:MAG: PAS domain-containing protein, partial [Prolixibacteraceae bacterium]|nr:PAS domain-containing protein [Prolixibacteraceae bacterium]